MPIALWVALALLGMQLGSQLLRAVALLEIKAVEPALVAGGGGAFSLVLIVGIARRARWAFFLAIGAWVIRPAALLVAGLMLDQIELIVAAIGLFVTDAVVAYAVLTSREAFFRTRESYGADARSAVAER